MKHFATLMLTFAWLATGPAFGSKGLHNNNAVDPEDNPHKVNVAGLPQEDVLIALWNHAMGREVEEEAKIYLGTLAFSLTRKKARKTDISLNRIEGRKMALSLKDGELECKAYNANHGAQRAQKVVQALRQLYEEQEKVSEAALNALIVNDWTEYFKQRYEDAKKVDWKENLTLATKLHGPIKNADCAGVTKAISGDDPNTQKFLAGLTALNLGKTGAVNRFALFQEFMTGNSSSEDEEEKESGEGKKVSPRNPPQSTTTDSVEKPAKVEKKQKLSPHRCTTRRGRAL